MQIKENSMWFVGDIENIPLVKRAFMLSKRLFIASYVNTSWGATVKGVVVVISRKKMTAQLLIHRCRLCNRDVPWLKGM